MGRIEGKVRTYINVQPVIPVSLSKDRNLISRTILPVVRQDDMAKDSDQFGLDDTVQSLFFSPRMPSNLGVNQRIDLCGQKIQIGARLRYWAASPDDGPERFGMTRKHSFLFPTGWGARPSG